MTKIEPIRYMNKNIIVPSNMDMGHCGTADDLYLCCDCKSPLMYVRQRWGVIEEYGLKIIGYRRNSYYRLHTIALILYCAECGDYVDDHFDSNEERFVYALKDAYIDEIDRKELECKLSEYNRTGTFKISSYDNVAMEMKEALDKYELKKYKKQYKKQNKKR